VIWSCALSCWNMRWWRRINGISRRGISVHSNFHR
jgi:hypothetical protein